MRASSKPLALLFGMRKEDDVLAFVGRNGYIEWTWQPDLLMRILFLCNGVTEIKHIAKTLNSKIGFVVSMLDLAESYGVVAEADKVYGQFHVDSENPSLFPTVLSAKQLSQVYESKLSWPKGNILYQVENTQDSKLLSLCNDRHSCRNFIQGDFTISDLNSLLYCMYSRAAVPSAGDLRPIIPFVYLFEDGKPYEKGLYFYRWDKMELVYSEYQPTLTEIQKCFPDEYQLVNTLCVLIISADLERICAKYGNRGYRYALIEAGHVAQNTYLWGAENSFGILEVGGYLDNAALEIIGMSRSNFAVLDVLFVGCQSVQPRIPVIKTSRDYLESYARRWVGPRKTIKWVNAITFPDQISARSYASAGYSLPGQSDLQFTWGSGSNLFEAQIKALSEAVERSSTSRVRVDVESTADELRDEEWLNPNSVAPLSKAQYRAQPRLEAFKPTSKWQWVRGLYLNSKKSVLVPIDLVFYPIDAEKFERRLCCFATSNGVAAHPNLNQAVQSGLLELIERDAFMRAWYNKEVLKRLDERFLNSELSEYVRAYRSNSVEAVFVYPLRKNSEIPVVFCLMRSLKGKAKFSMGAAASLGGYNEAAEKAFYEAESGWCSLPINPSKIQSMHEVNKIENHTLYYQEYGRQCNLAKFFNAEIVTPTDTVWTLDSYNPIVVQLFKSKLLNVVRVIEPNLVPIAFGYGLDYYLHPRLNREVDGRAQPLSSKSQPHCFS